ncbi:MAG: MarR family transcriptional regulator [Akkermansia sp.]|nr:MarR family transcriptional regulator [Akkermansia sp.]
MESLQKQPHDVFMKLLNITDDLRRDCFKQTPAIHQKKMLGLTLRQGSAIGQIRILTKEKPEGIALKTLASHLNMTVPATSLLVETMVTKGFFERNPNPEDRRAICIRLSEKGEALCHDVNARMESELDRLSVHITEEELAALDSIATKMGRLYYDEK